MNLVTIRFLSLFIISFITSNVINIADINQVELNINSDAYEMIGYSYDWIDKEKLEPIKVAIIDQGITEESGLNFNYLIKDNSIGSNNHGNVIANLLAAKYNPNTKYQGLIPGYPLYAYSLSKDDMSVHSLADAIRAVTNWKVDIICISLGTKNEDDYLEKAVKEALDQNILIVCSAGNFPNTKNFPAFFNLPGIISVGAIGADYNILPNTNTDSNIDIYAPGESIYSITTPNSTPAPYNGTSVAVPFVAASCIYLKKENPNLSAEEIERIIMQHSYQYEAKLNGNVSRINTLNFSNLR